jgi:phosphate uptake regulator
VQEQTVKLLALRQPMANDLRMVLSSIKIAPRSSASPTTPRTPPSAASC